MTEMVPCWMLFGPTSPRRWPELPVARLRLLLFGVPCAWGARLPPIPRQQREFKRRRVESSGAGRCGDTRSSTRSQSPARLNGPAPDAGTFSSHMSLTCWHRSGHAQGRGDARAQACPARGRARGFSVPPRVYDLAAWGAGIRPAGTSTIIITTTTAITAGMGMAMGGRRSRRRRRARRRSRRSRPTGR